MCRGHERRERLVKCRSEVGALKHIIGPTLMFGTKVKGAFHGTKQNTGETCVRQTYT